jgi:ATP-dependent helicase/nuclease subunit A
MSDSTKAQEKAIEARGNILVEAGAGAGKTRTLVDRCVGWLLDEKSPGSVDEILMVTFTEAAAAEMRHRLRVELERRAGKTEDPKTARHLAEQIALLDRAWICTLHGFCFQLVRRHFYKLGLDPRLILLAPERTAVLKRQAVSALLDRYYRNESDEAAAIQDLIEAHGKDWDKQVCDLILKVHEYAQSLPDPGDWFSRQRAYFESPEPQVWRTWLIEELMSCRPRWLATLQPLAKKNELARACAGVVMKLPAHPTRAQFAEGLREIEEIADSSKKGKGAISSFLKEARFLRSVTVVAATDPLAEDWNWAREPMLTLLGLAAEFGGIYSRMKQDAGGVDFQDLEQFALRLLWDKKSGEPTETALQWRRKIGMIFVDEYQDINGAQESIIRDLGREGAEANRFLVGDIKQSIYRFRLGDPRIFLRRKEEWSDAPNCQVIALSENFRSHQGILDFANSLFGYLMRKDVGGIDYDEDARLRCGNPEERPHALAPGGPRVELMLLHKKSSSDNHEDSLSEVPESPAAASASVTETEAHLVAKRLLRFHQDKTLIWDKEKRELRPVMWRDMAVLLRSHRANMEGYVKAFDDIGIPLAAMRTEFYEALEVRDLINLLSILDNPLQDIPVLGVLASPLVGLNAAELVAIRLARRPGRFWLAIADYLHQTQAASGSDKVLFEKVSRFMTNYRAWRRIARLRPVSQCLEHILDETHYADWLSAQPRGAWRRANVEQLLQLTRAFDSDRGEGLYRFLKFTEAHRKSDEDIEPAALPIADAVRIMSIHQSKGLEFPIVAVSDLDKDFNLQDSRSRVILDEELGLCPRVKPPGGKQFYPSLAHWISARRQERETIGEELRLLYVAVTRACDYLVLCGSVGKKDASHKWPEMALMESDSERVLEGKKYSHWVGSWLAKTCGAAEAGQDGESALIRWRYFDAETDPSENTRPSSPDEKPSDKTPPWNKAKNEKRWFAELEARLQYHYPFHPATTATAKSAVSTLRRQVARDEDDEAGSLFPSATMPVWKIPRMGPNDLNAAETGSAHHLFLELAQLDRLATKECMREEAARLLAGKLLSEAQVASLDFDALANFWQSEAGREILSHAKNVRRELPFTARFSCEELSRFGAPNYAAAGANEFVVVQGVIDLAIILPKEIWLLDFKTDSFAPSELSSRIENYRPQLALYAAAASRIFGRPVTRCWLHFLAAGKTALIEPQRLKLQQMSFFES